MDSGVSIDYDAISHLSIVSSVFLPWDGNDVVQDTHPSPQGAAGKEPRRALIIASTVLPYRSRSRALSRRTSASNVAQITTRCNAYFCEAYLTARTPPMPAVLAMTSGSCSYAMQTYALPDMVCPHDGSRIFNSLSERCRSAIRAS